MALGDSRRDSRFSAPVNKAAAAGSALHTRSRCRTHWLHSLMVQVSRMHQVAQRMCDSPPTCSRWPYLAIEHPTSTWHRIAAGASPSLHRWRQPQPKGVSPRGELRQAVRERSSPCAVRNACLPSFPADPCVSELTPSSQPHASRSSRFGGRSRLVASATELQ